MNSIIAHTQTKTDAAFTPALSGERCDAACFYASECNVLKLGVGMGSSSPFTQCIKGINIS